MKALFVSNKKVEFGNKDLELEEENHSDSSYSLDEEERKRIKYKISNPIAEEDFFTSSQSSSPRKKSSAKKKSSNHKKKEIKNLPKLRNIIAIDTRDKDLSYKRTA